MCESYFMPRTGAAFTFPLEPMIKHRLALGIQKEEVKRHGANWRRCVRRKAGATKASAIFLDSLRPPNCFKRVTFKVDKMLRKMTDPPEQEPDIWYLRLWSKAKAKVIYGVVPLLKTTSFLFDYAKDGFFFLHAYDRMAFIASKFIRGLICFHGLTITTSGVLMGLAVQFDSRIVNFDGLVYPNLAWPLRLVIFIATPAVPVVVILRALSLTTAKRRLESEWTRKQESICRLFLEHNHLDRKKLKVVKALADIKMVEVSSEGVPQLYILIVLYTLLAGDDCIGFLDHKDPTETTFLVLSLLQTCTTIILSTITSIDLKKNKQLNCKSKAVLALSISCQLAAKLWVMVWIARSSSRISSTNVVLLLVLPILVGWVLNLLLHARLNTDFHLLSTKGKLIHILSTTWFSLPVRRVEDRDQRHKRREIFFSLCLAGVNLVGTSVAYGLVVGNLRKGLIDVLLSSILFHLAGCALLLAFESTVHPWGNLDPERELGFWGQLSGSKKGVEAEPTIWDQVSLTSFLTSAKSFAIVSGSGC